MTLAEAAAALLWGDRLVDKLTPLSGLDDPPHPAVAVASLPGRPSGLALDDPRPRVPFPPDAHLDRPEARGLVLHAFANHELLALELMALALLRFPEADPRFRRGLVAILTQEQAHLAAYLRRLASTPLRFGDVPVNRFFWDHLSAAPTLPALMAGLSLTFEQANLDFAAHYAAVFRKLGDEDTAQVLDVVLAEEQSHVAHGLHWHDVWRGDLPRFEAWRAWLPAPLTPARGRGRPYRRDLRERAGFDADTLDALEIFSASKGRLPVLYRFDPDAEGELAGGPTRLREAWARDLELLTLAAAGADDVVWVRELPRPEHLRALRAAGFDLPELVTDPQGRAYGGFAPFGFSPRVAASWAAWGGPTWKPSFRDLASKAWLAERPALLGPGLAPPEDLPLVGRGLEEVRAAWDALGDRPKLMKAPFSTSGRERRRHWDPAWVQRTLKRQGAVRVEPWLDKVADFSFQAEGRRLIGWSRFETDAEGSFVRTWLGHPLAGLPEAVHRFVTREGTDPDWMPKIFRQVARDLAPWTESLPGPYGVDALLYRRPEGLALQPCLELNPRRTLGWVALQLARRVAPGRQATFELVPVADFQPDPPRFEGGRLSGGQLALTDPVRARMRVAVLRVVPKSERSAVHPAPR